MAWKPSFSSSSRFGAMWLRDPLFVGRVARLLILLTLVFISAAVTIVVMYLNPEARHVILAIQLVLLLVGVAMIFRLIRLVYREVIKPMDSVRSWASRMRAGDYSAELSVPSQGEFAGLLQDISQMGRWYTEIAFEGDDKVSEQMRQMARKTRLLEILYDVAASISVTRDLNEIISRFLQLSVDITHARCGVARLLDSEGDLMIADSINLDKEQLAERVAISDIVPGYSSKTRSIYIHSPLASVDFTMVVDDIDDDMECVTIPLLHQGDVMGTYQLLMDAQEWSLSYDLHELMTSIGYHLGLAIHQAQLDHDAQQRSISRERLTLAHELHDSLAQTMVSLRFQCKALQSSVDKNDVERADTEVRRLREGVDKANAELRDLLAHFRAPIDDRGLVPILTDIIKAFREENKILVFSQFHCHDPRPPANIQRHVVRIVQEALANIRKHADAHLVRILVRSETEGGAYVLVEDDGHGFEQERKGRAGEHIGLKIMQERAEQIGAELNVESEAGEGTRVELVFNWHSG